MDIGEPRRTIYIEPLEEPEVQPRVEPEPTPSEPVDPGLAPAPSHAG
jgi:hypothetical protein